MAAAERALVIQDWETAISRAYYALYHAVIALLEAKAGLRRSRWDHVELQRELRVQFASRGFLLSVNDARDFARLFDARIAADYGKEMLRPGQVQTFIANARSLYAKIEKVIQDA